MVSDDRKVQLFEPDKQCSTYKGRKTEWLALFFLEESNLKCWEKRNVKLTENCIENTDFAYAARSRPGHMPRQLLARLSGIRSIGAGQTIPDFGMILNFVMIF